MDDDLLDEDDLFDPGDLLDLGTPTGLLFAAASGMLDDDCECDCACGCDRQVSEPGDICRACEKGRHADSPDR